MVANDLALSYMSEPKFSYASAFLATYFIPFTYFFRISHKPSEIVACHS